MMTFVVCTVLLLFLAAVAVERQEAPRPVRIRRDEPPALLHDRRD